ncbi:hypothetical protein ABIE49_008064 [Bradyrhizobium sp. OAE829]
MSALRSIDMRSVGVAARDGCCHYQRADTEDEAAAV